MTSPVRTPRPYTAVTRTTQEVAKAIQNARFDVGIISPLVMGDHGEVIRGLREENEFAPEVFAPIHYSTHDIDTSSITMSVKRALAEKMHAIVSVGGRVAQVASEILEKEAPDIPHLCLSPGPSLGTQLVARATALTGNCATIMLKPYEITAALTFLCEALPTRKNILAPYHSPTTWEEVHKGPVTRFLAEKGYSVTSFTEKTLLDGHQKIGKALNDTDVLFLPEGSGYNEMGYYITDLCQEKKVVIFGGSIHAVQEYAPLGFGTDLKAVGVEAVYYLHRILGQATTPADLPLNYVDCARTPLLNKKLAEKWQLDVAAIEKLSGVVTL